MAEAVECLGDEAEFVAALLALDGGLIIALAKPADILEHGLQGLLGKGAHGEEQAGHDGAEDDKTGNDHDRRLCLHGGTGGAVRNIDDDRPGGVDAGNLEGEEQAIECIGAVFLEILDQAALAGRQGRLQRVGACDLIGLHQQVVGGGDQPLAVLCHQHHAAGLERAKRLEFLRQRGERDVHPRDADDLAAGQDRIGDRAHGRRDIRALGEIGRGDRALAALRRQRIPFGGVIVVEGRELDPAIAVLRPVGREDAICVRPEFGIADHVVLASVEGLLDLGKPAAEGEGVLFEVGLEQVHRALAVEGLALVAAAQHARHGSCGAGQFADVAGNFLGYGFRLGRRLLHCQRLDAVARLIDQEKIGEHEDQGDRHAGHDEQLRRDRAGNELQHGNLETHRGGSGDTTGRSTPSWCASTIALLSRGCTPI